MTILKQNSKVIINLAVEVINNSASDSNLKIKVDTDLQIPNRIFKDGSNQVKQITDKTSNIPFVEQGGKAIYNYEGYFEFDGTKGYTSHGKVPSMPQNFTYELWYQKTSFPGIQVLMQKGTGSPLDREFTTYFDTSNTFRMLLYSDVSTNSNIFIDNLPSTGFHNITIQKDGTQIKIFVDGVYKKIQTLSTSTVYNNLLQWTIAHSIGFGSFKFDDDLKSLAISEGAKYDTSGFSINDQVFTPKEPFIFYKRFKNPAIKTYTNSKYLKNAVINSNNEITKIYDEQDNIWLDVGTTAVKIDKQGFDFGTTAQGAVLQYQESFNPQNKDFFIGFWAKPSSVSGVQVFLSNWNSSPEKSFQLIMNGGALQLFLSDDGSTNTSITSTGISFTLSKFTYISIQRVNDVLYFEKDGVLKSTYNLPANFTINTVAQKLEMGIATSGSPYGGILNDFIYSEIDGLVDPTGFSVGEKVFESPRRGGFDSEIIQF